MSNHLKINCLVVLLTIYAVIASTSSGQNWFPTSAPSQSWTVLTMSSDGNRLMAVSSQGPVYTSTNAGLNWMQSGAPSGHWICGASSSDGMNLLIGGGYLNNLIYRSTDSGTTWTPTGAPGNEWYSLASSSDGSILLGGAYGNSLYVSTNSGISWTNRIFGQYWGPLFSSFDGSLLAAFGGNPGGVFISTNFGVSWTLTLSPPAQQWLSLVGTTNGSTLILNSTSGQMFVSTNFGTSWVTNKFPNGMSGPLAVSGDAGLWVIGTSGGICTSTNFGFTWTTNHAPNNISWSQVASSVDGTKLAAVGNNLVYMSPLPETKGAVIAWDLNNYGQATVPSDLGPATAIAGSEYDSLALLTNGTVAAWGLDDLEETNVPSNLTNVVAVAASQQLSLALINDGTVGWWGWSSYTNIISSLSNVVAVAASQGNFYLALGGNGIVTAWGANSYGQTNVPPTLSNVIAIAVGDYHSMALKNDGTVAVWGGNTSGIYSPTNIPAGLSNVVAIAAGNVCSLALKNDGTITGWPTNDPNVVQRIPNGLSNVVSIAADYQHALAETSDGSVWEWGTVGTGFLNYQVGLTNVVGIACGYYHSLALAGDGSPSIVRQPWTRSVYGGYSAFMYAGVVGSQPTAYQWQLNGSNIDNATNMLLTLNNVTPANAGTYTLVASNSQGSVTSSGANLTVITNSPILTLQPTGQTGIVGSNVTFSVAVGTGPIPNKYQWQFNDTNIFGATNLSLTVTNVQITNQGDYSVVVNNGYGATTSSNAFLTVIVLDLPTALNTPGWTWTNGGSAAWFAQTNSSHDGFEAAQSGLVTNGQSSTLQTTVTGPGTLTFWWMFSPLTSPFPNTLSFSSSQGNASASVNSTTGWQQVTNYLGTGQQTLTWNYSRSSLFSAQSTGWVDQVSFTPGGTAPIINTLSTNRFVLHGTNVSFAVGAVGTPPLAYQWQFNGSNILGKTNNTFSLTGVQYTNSGAYSVVISNAFGLTNSSNAMLFVRGPVFTVNGGLGYSPQGFNLLLNGLTGHGPITIFSSSNLVNWQPIFTNPATIGSIQFLDTNAVASPFQFYKAMEQ